MHELVIVVAKYLVIVPILATAALLIVVTLNGGKLDKYGGNRAKYILLARLIIGGIIALIIAYIARHLYNDPRPFVVGHFKPYFSHSADNGFVSDHTLLASFLAFTCFFYKKWVGVVLFLVAIAIGAARVIAGVHHWVDIGSAIGVSLVSALIALAATSWLKQKKQYKKP